MRMHIIYISFYHWVLKATWRKIPTWDWKRILRIRGNILNNSTQGLWTSFLFPCNNISILVLHTAIITGMGKYVTWNGRSLKVFLHIQSFKEIVWLIDQGKSSLRLFFRCLPGARCVKKMRVCLQKEDTNSGSLSSEIRWLYLIIVIHFWERY